MRTTPRRLIPTGIVGLDDVLMGGLPERNVLLIEGPPGTGKTTLGLEFVYRGAKDFGEPGVVVTFEISPESMLLDAQGFGWDLAELERQGKLKIVYTTPQVILHEILTSEGVLSAEIARIGARRVLIDGIAPLRLFGEDPGGRPFRETLHLLLDMLRRTGMSAALTRETPEDSLVIPGEVGDERYLCDTVLTLSRRARERATLRYLEVTKSRGHDSIPGRHTLRIESGRGIHVYRRAQSRPRVRENQPTSVERSSVGNAELDRMLGGGVIDGSITLVVGISGTGKTVAGLQFLASGAAEGKRGLLVTLEEHPAQILRNADALGIDLRRHVESGQIQILFESPLELELDVHFDRIVQLCEEERVQRVVIDSLGPYESAASGEARGFTNALATYFKDRLVTAFITYESPELIGISQISEGLHASTVVDNIIVLNYVEVSTRLRRAITVPKARGSKNSNYTREYTIDTKGGLAVLEEAVSDEVPAVPQLPFSAYYGLLARAPTRRSPVIEERMVRGEELPESTPRRKA